MDSRPGNSETLPMFMRWAQCAYLWDGRHVARCSPLSLLKCFEVVPHSFSLSSEESTGLRGAAFPTHVNARDRDLRLTLNLMAIRKAQISWGQVTVRQRIKHDALAQVLAATLGMLGPELAAFFVKSPCVSSTCWFGQK